MPWESSWSWGNWKGELGATADSDWRTPGICGQIPTELNTNHGFLQIFPWMDMGISQPHQATCPCVNKSAGIRAIGFRGKAEISSATDLRIQINLKCKLKSDSNSTCNFMGFRRPEFRIWPNSCYDFFQDLCMALEKILMHEHKWVLTPQNMSRW